jgi:hypothetical protein
MFNNTSSGQSGISKIDNQGNDKRKCKKVPRTVQGMARAIEFRDSVLAVSRAVAEALI